MGIKITTKEVEFLVSASNDFLEYGKTDKSCPRCGGKIVEINKGSSYIIKCETKDCISTVFRGI